MKTRFLTILLLALITSSLTAQSYVVLLINEKTEEIVVLSKREIRDILTIDHRYLGRAERITSTGVEASFQHYAIDSIHSIVVKHGNFGAKLGLPFKVVGVGLAAIGGLMMKAGTEQQKNDNQGINPPEDSGNTGLFIGGLLTVGSGLGSFLLGQSMGNRPIEKEKTTYYFHQWKVKIVDRKNVGRYKSSLKK